MKFLVFVQLTIEIIEKRICNFASTLPGDPEKRDKIIQRYRELKGYEFLNQKSKLIKHFQHRQHVAEEHRRR